MEKRELFDKMFLVMDVDVDVDVDVEEVEDVGEHGVEKEIIPMKQMKEDFKNIIKRNNNKSDKKKNKCKKKTKQRENTISSLYIQKDEIIFEKKKFFYSRVLKYIYPK